MESVDSDQTLHSAASVLGPHMPRSLLGLPGVKELITVSYHIYFNKHFLPNKQNSSLVYGKNMARCHQIGLKIPKFLIVYNLPKFVSRTVQYFKDS